MSPSRQSAGGRVATDSATQTASLLAFPKARRHQAPPLVFERLSFWHRYTGTREQLLAAGACSPDDFPMPPKRIRYGDLITVRRLKAGRWLVDVELTAEQIRNQTANDAEQARRADDARVALSFLQGLPRNVAEARRVVARLANLSTMALDMIRRDPALEPAGYRLASADERRAQMLCTQLAALLRSATIERDDTRYDARLAELEHRAGLRPDAAAGLRLVANDYQAKGARHV